MIRLVYFELKKNLFHSTVLIALLLFLAANFYKISEIYRYDIAYSSPSVAEMRNAYWSLYETFSGEITQEKIDDIIALFADMENDYKNHNFVHVYDKEIYQSGYFSYDYVLYTRDFYSEMKRNGEYAAYSQKIAEQALKNADFFAEKGNDYEENRNRLIAETMQGRSVRDFYWTRGWQKYFDYQFSALAVFGMLTMCVPMLFTYEHEAQMSSVNATSRYGGLRLRLAKLIAMEAEIFFFFLIFTLSDLVGFHSIYVLTNPNAPIYSMANFIHTPVNLTIFGGVLFDFFMKYIGFSICSLFMALLSFLNRRGIWSYTFCILFEILFILSFYSGEFSPMNLIVGRKLLKNFSAVNLFSNAILTLEFLSIISFLICLVLSLIILFLKLNQEGERDEK